MTGLVRLDLSYNSLYDPIPELPASVQHMLFGNNYDLSGPIPDLSKMHAVQSAWLVHNNLSGTIL